jgi:hypothetical protein
LNIYTKNKNKYWLSEAVLFFTKETGTGYLKASFQKIAFSQQCSKICFKKPHPPLKLEEVSGCTARQPFP